MRSGMYRSPPSSSSSSSTTTGVVLGVSILSVCGFIFFVALRSSSLSSPDPALKALPPRVLAGSSAADDGRVALRELLSAAVDVAERGGKEVIKIKRGGDLHQKSKGTLLDGKVDDPVTAADMLSHKQIVGALRAQWGDRIHIVSEEHADPKEDAAVYWPPVLDSFPSLPDVRIAADRITVWVDPLDATKEFTENLLNYVTVMTCIAIDGVPWAGVIHQPFAENKGLAETGHTVWGFNGAGMGHANSGIQDEHIKSSTTRVIVSRSHAGDVKEVADKAFPNPEVIPAGGAGFKTQSVVNHEADMYLHTTKIKKWDFCAGDALLRSNNGIMTDLDGNEFDYSYDKNPVNKGGILGARTIREHTKYLAALGPAFRKKH